MATKKQRTSNVQSTVYETVLATCKPNEVFHASSFELEGLTEKQVGNALSVLSRKGFLKRVGIKGNYSIASSPMNPAKAIYDLLEFMAAAEAPLRRAAKILEAVEES